jgi:hypothetical protein
MEKGFRGYAQSKSRATPENYFFPGCDTVDCGKKIPVLEKSDVTFFSCIEAV